MMHSPLKLLLTMLVVFCFAAVGIEVYRFISFQLEMERSLEAMMRDAIDLHLDDDYRSSHISYIPPGEIGDTKAFLVEMIRERYKLNAFMAQPEERDFKGSMEIPTEKFKISGGSVRSYTTATGFSEHRQENTPHGEITVRMQYKPLIFRMQDAVSADSLLMEISVEVDLEHFDDY